jgi:4-cresol dehydrogenase (hydroxylating)
MNRVLEVDDKNHYALVEPGVSYFDLYRYIQEKRLKVWIDPPDPGWGSLVGNALERGGGYTPMRDHFDAHCGMEVVLANGDVVRTGMGALPNAKTWQQYKYGFGPHVDGIFSQSNFGIVTKMGFWLYPEPEAYFSGNVMVPKHDDIHALVETLAHLLNSGVVQGTTSVLNTVDFGPPDPELARIRVGSSTIDLERYVAQKGLGYWTVDLCRSTDRRRSLPRSGSMRRRSSRGSPASPFATAPRTGFRSTRRRSRRFPIRFRSACPASRPSPSEARAVRGTCGSRRSSR